MLFINYKKVVLYTAIVLLFIGIFLLGFYSGGFEDNVKKANNVQYQSFEEKIVTAKVVGKDSNGNGVVSDLVTEIRPGSGLVLVNINNVLADLNTQYSARLAALVAKNYTGIDLLDKDVVFNIKTDVNVIGGQSGGSTMAASTIAALLNKTIRKDVIMTGSILEDGTMGEAGSIKEKAIAARDANATLLLVPPEAASELGTTKREKVCAEYDSKEYCEVRYIDDKINIGDNIGIKVLEVNTIEEALKHYFEDETEI